MILSTCRDLTALFVPSPKPAARHVRHDQPLVVAGAESKCDVSLERMQVFHCNRDHFLAVCSAACLVTAAKVQALLCFEAFQHCFSQMPARYRIVMCRFAQKIPGICRLLCASGHPCSMACLAGARRTASMLCQAPQLPLLLPKAPKGTRMVTEDRPTISRGSSMSIQAKNNTFSLLQHPWWVVLSHCCGIIDCTAAQRALQSKKKEKKIYTVRCHNGSL